MTVRIANDLNKIISLRLSESLMGKLRMYAKENGLPVSLSIRMILTKYLKSHPR